MTRNRELDEPNALVERIARAVHSHILATEPQTTGAGIVAVIRGFIRGEVKHSHVDRADCWCQPVRDYKDPVTETEVWVHRDVVS